MDFFHRRTLLWVAFIVALLFTSMFALRFARQVRRFHGDSSKPVQPWMNIPFISRTYDVPPMALHEVLGLPPDVRDPRPLNAIARSQGVAVSEIVARVQALIDRQAAPPPSPPTPNIQQEAP